MAKRLSRATLNVLNIIIVIYKKFVRKHFGVTGALFFVSFNLHNVVLIGGCNTYEMHGDNNFETTCPIFVNVAKRFHALRVT